MTGGRRGDELASILRNAAGGHFPPRDGQIDVLPSPTSHLEAVLAFTAHFVVVTSVDPAWVRAQLPPGDFLAPLSPRFLVALSDRSGGTPGSLDVVLAAPPLDGDVPPLVELEPDTGVERVGRALRYRRGVRQFTTADGLSHLIVGRGLAGRLEASIEVHPDRWNIGVGRDLMRAARTLTDSEPVFTQTAPGNAASLRAILAAGFEPIGSEILFLRSDR